MAAYLYHFSEDPTIEVFAPRDQFVWADDEWHQFRYWFPRECPRATWWRKDRGGHATVAIQWDWLDVFVTCELFAYTLDAAPFRQNPEGGGWITEQTMTPLDVAPVGPLLERHRDRGNEFRVVPDLKALWQEVIARPEFDFSGIRMRNLG